MKKFIYLALALFALPFALTSCSDDDDLPNVDYTISIADGYLDPATNTIYVVQGNTLRIESLSVKNLDSDKPATLNYADYYWDYEYIGGTQIIPFAYNIDVTEATPVGQHLLTIKTMVLAVDKEPGVGIVNYPVQVVASEDDMPGTATSRSFTVSPGFKSR